MVVIELSPKEIFNAKKIANDITVWAKLYKAKQRYGLKSNPMLNWELNLKGCLGEQAVAKYLGVPYEYTEYDKEAYDVMGYEVRATFHENGQLLNHPDDKTGIYILAIINPESYAVTLAGWSTKRRAIQHRYWNTKLPRPCYATPQAELWPMDMMPATRHYVQHLSDIHSA